VGDCWWLTADQVPEASVELLEGGRLWLSEQLRLRAEYGPHDDSSMLLQARAAVVSEDGGVSGVDLTVTDALTDDRPHIARLTGSVGRAYVAAVGGLPRRWRGRAGVLVVVQSPRSSKPSLKVLGVDPRAVDGRGRLHAEHVQRSVTRIR
jgi:hypothetical protein